MTPPVENETALLSETALKKDWLRPEEDAAWAHLQLGKKEPNDGDCPS